MQYRRSATLKGQYALGHYLLTIKGDKMRSEADIEKEINNINEDMKKFDDEGILYKQSLIATREALEWVLGSDY